MGWPKGDEAEAFGHATRTLPLKAIDRRSRYAMKLRPLATLRERFR
ncbi:MAG: hypothetical protein F6K26_53495 [Moorea sp. SIO2I5]|nr:hypothetical protein [Moorena sp. SIO2I5]